MSAGGGIAGEQQHPRSLADAILSAAQFLALDASRVHEVAARLSALQLRIPRRSASEVHLATEEPEEVARYFVVFNALNYCFWDPESRRRSSYVDGKHSGATLLAKRLTNSWDKLADAEYLMAVTEEELERTLFPPPSRIPLLVERVASLQEVGRALAAISRQRRSLVDVFAELDGHAYGIAKSLAARMPGWQDPFLKRAQLCVGMIFGRLQDHPDNPVAQDSIAHLTAFADYRLPQALIAMGIVRPASKLATALADCKSLPEGSTMEQEIRAATIVACDALVAAVNALVPERDRVNTLQIDSFLWRAIHRSRSSEETRQLFVTELPNHHRTVTTRY